ncbi:hypothetical protein QTP86_031109, partial [Hemibagrus guttatus]
HLRQAQTDINIYTSSVLDHINTCIDNVTTVKDMKHFPNQKPWMNSEVCLLLKARDAAFKSGDAEDYSRARGNLKRGIRKAKHGHKLHIKEHFHSNSDPRRMRKGIQTITDHKPSIQSLLASNAFLPDELNHFFACLDKGVIHHTRNTDPSTVFHPISLSTTELHSALSRVDPRKSAGPDGIPGRVLRACADQLARVFTDIFNLSLAQTHAEGRVGVCGLWGSGVEDQFVGGMHHQRMDLHPVDQRSGHICSTTITLITGVPQGCVLSPFLYSLFTHDCRPVYGSNSIIKFADYTTVIGLIRDNDETAYRAEVQHLVAWCADNNLLLNTSKMKELIIDFRREKGRMHDPIHINGMAVERVSSFKFLGTHISEDLSWTTSTSSLRRDMRTAETRGELRHENRRDVRTAEM